MFLLQRVRTLLRQRRLHRRLLRSASRLQELLLLLLLLLLHRQRQGRGNLQRRQGGLLKDQTHTAGLAHTDLRLILCLQDQQWVPQRHQHQA